MEANQKFARVDTLEQKAAIYRMIGRERADTYFELLKNFFCSKVGKNEFDKSCMRILGNENLCLHNQLIRAILNNSCVGTVSPIRVNKFQDRPIEVASVEDGEEVEQAAERLGIQSKALSGGTQKKLHALTCQQTGKLPDAKSLMNHLEQKLEADGFNISVDCANVMNNGLDCYLKRLIEPCIRLAGSRCIKEHPQHVLDKRITGLRGMLPAKKRFLEKPSNSVYASLLDFCVVMESNPCILGGGWPVLLEKVCARALEE